MSHSYLAKWWLFALGKSQRCCIAKFSNVSKLHFPDDPWEKGLKCFNLTTWKVHVHQNDMFDETTLQYVPTSTIPTISKCDQWSNQFRLWAWWVIQMHPQATIIVQQNAMQSYSYLIKAILSCQSMKVTTKVW